MAEPKMLDLGRNHLLYGDCLEMLGRVPDGCVDLVYLDPPFNSNANYNMLFGSETGEDTAQVKAFADTWYWHAGHDEVYLRLLERQGAVGHVTEAMFIMLGRCGMLAYLLFMTERLIELHRVLKTTGSLYLHCDPTASHYLKLVLDAVFGTKMFRNEIVWCYKSRPQPRKYFGRKHDVIFFYSKSDKYSFNWSSVLRDLSPATISKYRHEDENGRLFRLQGRGIQNSPIRSAKDVPLEWEKSHPHLVVRDYLDSKAGTGREDWWDDINIVNQAARERLGYPTQKPLALLRRIIEASSNEGDIVLDPFCGCGTAVDAAQALGRRWIGMDVSALTINIIRARMEDVHGDHVMTDVEVTGIPTSIEAARMLFNKDPFDFERWAVDLIHARPNDKQTGDAGSDGTLSFPAREKGRTQRGIVSVKGGANIGPAMVRDLRGTVEAMHAAMGVLICMETPTKGMVAEAAKAGLWQDQFTNNSYPRLQIITIAELLDDKHPNMPTPRNPYTKATYTHTATKQGALL